IQRFLASDGSGALRAQLVLADLTVIARESPALQRVITMVNPDDLDAPSSLYAALLNGLHDNPYLSAVTAADAFANVPAATNGATPVERELAPASAPEPAVSPGAYTNERSRLSSFGGLARFGDPTVAAADRSLLASVSSAWPPDTARVRAAAHLRVVDRVIGQFLHLIQVPNPRTITPPSPSP